MKIKSLHLNISFSLVILIIIFLFMRLAILTRIAEYNGLQSQTAQNLTNNTVKRVELYIQSQHQLLTLFIESQSKQIATVIQQPKNNLALEALRLKAQRYFSAYKQLFIVNSNGQPTLTGMSSPIGKTCANDVKLYAQSPHLQKLFIHNSANIGKHIDIIDGIPNADEFMFVALDIEQIFSIISYDNTHKLNLALLKNDDSNSIELEHSSGSGIYSQNNPDFIFEKSIAGTKWKVRTVIDQDVLEQYKERLIKRATGMWFILLFTCVIFIWRLYISDKDKTLIENQLIALNNDLEKNIHQRTIELEQSLSDYAYQAKHDYLTDLLTRHAFEEIVIESINAKKRPFLLYFSLDHFKLVNETSSHIAGDKLLIQLANMFSNIVAPSPLARIGSDEFAVLLHNNESLNDALLVAEKLVDETAKLEFNYQKRIHRVTLSLAIIPIDEKTTNIDALLGIADTSLGFAKKSKTNKIFVYDESNQLVQEHQNRLRTANSIVDDIEACKFLLYGHSIVSLQQPVNLQWTEALVRKKLDNGIIAEPDYFIPIAEEFNRIDEIDCYMIEQSLNWLGHQAKKSRININLSGKTLSNTKLIPFITQHINKLSINPNDVCFEITETASIDKMDYAVNFITAMKKLGCLTALDDFGTGLSSLSYLKTLDVDFVKIDGEFIKDICTNPVDLVMVKSITQICQTLNKITIAEYVENKATADLLKDLGVDYAQGFYYHEPEFLRKD